MSLYRVGVLLYRELVQGPKNIIFIFAVVVPLVLSFVLALLFGTLFSGKPRLGIVDEGSSQLSQSAAAMTSIRLTIFDTQAGLEEATRRGAIDMGVVVPADFDAQLAAGQPTTMIAYVWGESLLKDRALLGTALVAWARQIAGQELPVTLTTTMLGDTVALPWQDRLLPLLILMSVVFGAMMLPASSLVSEKQHRTLTALAITPATTADVYLAKGLLGVGLSTVMALVVLALNGALNEQTGLVAGVLLLGAIFSAELGIVMGVLVKDVNSLFATIKAIGLLLYAPALIALFPDIPQWIARIFPTYYLVQPVIEIVQHNAQFADIAGLLGVLLALIAVTGAILALLARRNYRFGTV
ncbi:MAG: ABC transporter permease [Chloroflexia bacterium]|nr:ABC transporter permease [Chloroflexia bacterium]